MTFWNYYVLAIIIVYLLAFFVRNIKTYINVKRSIRGKSGKLTLSVIISTIVYLVALANVFFPEIRNIAGQIAFLEFTALQYVGYGVLSLAMIIGLLALYELSDSWRVGIRPEQKTDLVTTGIYAWSRNPYFLSYDLLFLGIFFIFPSLVLLLLITTLSVVFHLMILEEESYLDKVQGEPYQVYKREVGRYFSFKLSLKQNSEI